MLNQYLSRTILEKTFSPIQLVNLDSILEAIDPEKNKHIIQDQNLLGEIHHAVNLYKY